MKAMLQIGVLRKCVDLYKHPKWCLVFFILAGLAIIVVVSAMQLTKSSPADAKTSSGYVRGTACTTSSGRTYVSFEGLPYAQPPLGPLRFKDPQLPPAAWKGVLHARVPRAVCLKAISIDTGDTTGDEDCLYLNVYTPVMDGKAAVMVWLGNRNFIADNEDIVNLRPDWIIDKDIVLITVEYRLGMLGFLKTGDRVSPGNYGLKDQVAALRWVQDNVAAFGGDPARVTIAGVAAGAASVTFHLLSPLSAGLFSGAIAMTGSALNPWAFCPYVYIGAIRLSAYLARQMFKNSSQLVDFLRTVPAAELVIMECSILSQEEMITGMCLQFVPSTEPDSDTAFLTEPPWRVLESVLPNAVPLLTGATSMTDVRLPSVTLEVLDNYTMEVVTGELRLRTLEERQRGAAKVRLFYIGDEAITTVNPQDVQNMLADLLFLEGIDRMARTVASLSSHPVFYYHYTYGKNTSDEQDALDMLYSTADEQELDPDSEEAIFYDTWRTLLTEFVKTGKPSAAGVSWPPYTVANPSYLLVDQPMRAERDLLPARMNFWRTLLPPWGRV